MENRTAAEATVYLHEHIPLSAAMGIAVERLDTEVAWLIAPLGPNINHRQTAFGGSLASLATLAAWTYLHFRLRAELPDGTCRIVIADCKIEYHLPIDREMTARALAPETVKWERFTHSLRRRGKGRIQLPAMVFAGIYTDGEPAVTFVGTFVALRQVGDTHREPIGDPVP